MKKAILKAAIFTPLSNGRWGLPLLFWGEPGIAKTSVIEEVAASFEMHCETLSPSERGEAAFGIVPVPSGEGENMTILNPRPDWTRMFDKSGRGVVFVDEMTSTPPALQAPLMGLLLAKRIGGHTLPKGVRVLGAANPADLAAGGYELSAPVANRLGHIEWTAPTVEEHTAYMMRGSSGAGGEDAATTNPEHEERRVLEAWPDAWATAVGYEAAFLNRRQSLKNQCPKAGDPKASRAFPTDRSWENATRALASGFVNGLSESEREVFVSSFISEKVASEFFEFMEKQDLPDPAELLDGNEKFKHNPQRVDRTIAVLSACTALVTPANAKLRSQRCSALWGLLQDMTENKADHDIIVPSVHALIGSGQHTMKESAKVLAKLNPVLKAAGVTPGGGR